MALAAPNSEVDICNLAATLLREGINVAQLDPPTTDPEKIFNLWYQQERLSTLRQYTWKFAIKRIQLAPSATPPPFGFGQAFDLPNDFVRFIQIHTDSNDELFNYGGHKHYSIEGNQILVSDLIEPTNILNLRYIYDNQDVTTWDPLFVNLFAANLAIRVAPSFGTTAQRRVGVLLDLRASLNREARAVDGQENPVRRVQRSRFNGARRRLSSDFSHLIFFDGYHR